MGSVTWRKRGRRYQVSWRLDDGSQGADSADEARDPAAEKRLELRRGRLPFSRWAKGPPPKRRVDPEQVFAKAKRRALTP